MLGKQYVGGAGVYAPTRATQVQHCFLDPSNGTVIDMAIPFQFNKGWIDLIFGDVLGQLRVQVLNQLQAASGSSTSVEVKVFVSFEDAHFRVPRPGGLTFTERRTRNDLLLERKTLQDELSALRSEYDAVVRRSNTVQNYHSAGHGEESDGWDDVSCPPTPKPRTKVTLGEPILLRSNRAASYLPKNVIPIRKRVEAEEQSGVFRSAGAAVGSKLDKLAEDVLPKEITGMLAGVCLDKPAVTDFPEPLVSKDAQYMSATRGIEKVERMTAEPSAQYITTDQFGTTVDEMDMKFILKKATFLETFNWSSTDGVGTVLYSKVSSPMHLLPESVPTVFDPVPLVFLGNLFSYWRGGLVYFFQVVGTAFHEGRLDFCNHPGTTTVPSDYSTAMSQYVNSQTVRNTNNTIEVRIPFHSDTPWKRVWNGEGLADVPTEGYVRSMDYVVGCFSIRVAVPLKNPNNVANNVDVNVFVAAADDFDFHTTSLIGGRYVPFLPARTLKEVRAREEAGDLNTDGKDDSGVITLGITDTGSGVYTHDHGDAHHFGETYSSLREMCKRYVFTSQQKFSLSEGSGNLNHFQFTPTVVGGLPQYLAGCYRLFRGPYNAKLALDVDGLGITSPPSRVTGFCTTNVQPAIESTGSLAGLDAILSGNKVTTSPLQPPLVRFSTTHVAEFQFPFQSIYHSLLIEKPEWELTPEYFDNMYAQWDLPYCIDCAGGGPVAVLSLATSFADETRMGVWLGCPTVTTVTPLYPNPGS
jgi:hypothetical protein